MSLLLIKPGHEIRVDMPMQMVISHNHDIYTLPDFSHEIEYIHSHKLDENEWFYISEFRSKEFTNDFIERDYSNGEVIQLNATHFSKGKYLCVNENNMKFFQKLTPSNFIRKKMFNINEGSFIESGNILTINNVPDAVYDIELDKLYFKDLSKISSLFNNIDSLYREATNDEVNSFLSHELITLGVDTFNVGIPNRKKIAKALDKLNLFSNDDKKYISDYIKDYYPALKIENNKFSITSDVELKHFIYGVEQRFYTTRIGSEKRIASAVLNLP